MEKLLRIAIFIDGGYFESVSNYYKYAHEKRLRIGIEGLQYFIRHTVSEREKIDVSNCQIVESHYFRGRYSAKSASEKGKLEDQAAFDEVLIKAGIIQHFMPLRYNVRSQKEEETGIDVWLSLEAFDLAVHKKFDVCALICCDGDYVPLVRKLHGIGTRTLLLAWEFKYDFKDSAGKDIHKETKTAQTLIDAVTHSVTMHTLIDDKSKRNDPIIGNLFSKPA